MDLLAWNDLQFGDGFCMLVWRVTFSAFGTIVITRQGSCSRLQIRLIS